MAQPEIFRTPPQGAVVLELATPSDSAETRLQEVLPEVKDLATKVGGWRTSPISSRP
jgi:hypothetical protein